MLSEVALLLAILSAKITKKLKYMPATEIQVLPPLTYNANVSTRFRVALFVRNSTNLRFLKFDPSKVRYMEVRALDLRPDLAKVGVEIRVVGYLSSISLSNCRNDAGEKLSYVNPFAF